MKERATGNAPVSLGNDMPLKEVLDRIAEELAGTAALIESIEPHLAAAHHPGESGRSLMALQGIDLAGQQISGLAEFLSTLGRSVHDDYLVETGEALDVVKLSEMKARLARRAERPVAVLAKAVGNFEMF